MKTFLEKIKTYYTANKKQVIVGVISSVVLIGLVWKLAKRKK